MGRDWRIGRRRRRWICVGALLWVCGCWSGGHGAAPAAPQRRQGSPSLAICAVRQRRRVWSGREDVCGNGGGGGSGGGSGGGGGDDDRSSP